MIADIADRASIERIYPAEAFAFDAGANSDPKATVRRGVRIASPPDESGAFVLEPAARQVAETSGSDDVAFLCPDYVGTVADPDAGASYGAAGEGEGVPGPAKTPTKTDEYGTFVDRIIATARSLRHRNSPGPGDDRLRGLRQ